MKRQYESERMIFKVLDERDAAIVLAYYQKNKAFLEQWEHQKNASYYTIENQRLTLRLEEEGFLRGEMVRYWLFLKGRENDAPIGCISLTNIIRGVFKSCFLGYKIDVDFQNEGYMTEAIGKVVDIAFNEMKLHRIEANIMPRNKRSLRTVEKNGFVNEGIARKYLKINGVWEDHYHMVKLNELIE